MGGRWVDVCQFDYSLLLGNHSEWIALPIAMHDRSEKISKIEWTDDEEE